MENLVAKNYWKYFQKFYNSFENSNEYESDGEASVKYGHASDIYKDLKKLNTSKRKELIKKIKELEEAEEYALNDGCGWKADCIRAAYQSINEYVYGTNPIPEGAWDEWGIWKNC